MWSEPRVASKSSTCLRDKRGGVGDARLGLSFIRENARKKSTNARETAAAREEAQAVVGREGRVVLDVVDRAARADDDVRERGGRRGRAVAHEQLSVVVVSREVERRAKLLEQRQQLRDEVVARPVLGVS